MGTYYRNITKFIDTIDNGHWIEIGVDRGEGSTKFFADLCQARGVDFYGVYMDAEQIKRATSNLMVDGTLPDHVKLAQAKAKNFYNSWIQQLKYHWHILTTLIGITG